MQISSKDRKKYTNLVIRSQEIHNFLQEIAKNSQISIRNCKKNTHMSVKDREKHANIVKKRTKLGLESHKTRFR